MIKNNNFIILNIITSIILLPISILLIYLYIDYKWIAYCNQNINKNILLCISFFILLCQLILSFSYYLLKKNKCISFSIVQIIFVYLLLLCISIILITCGYDLVYNNCLNKGYLLLFIGSILSIFSFLKGIYLFCCSL